MSNRFFLQNTHLDICTWTKYSAFDSEVNHSILNELEVIGNGWKRYEKHAGPFDVEE